MKSAASAAVATPSLPRPVGLAARLGAFARSVWPGLMMSLVVALAAVGLGGLEREAVGKVWLEPLVLAILLGAGGRAAWTPDERFRVGIDFSAKILLEVAVVLLGASVSAATLSSLGLGFVAGVFALVAAAILVGFGIGRRAWPCWWRAATPSAATRPSPPWPR